MLRPDDPGILERSGWLLEQTGPCAVLVKCPYCEVSFIYDPERLDRTVIHPAALNGYGDAIFTHVFSHVVHARVGYRTTLRAEPAVRAVELFLAVVMALTEQARSDHPELVQDALRAMGPLMQPWCGEAGDALIATTTSLPSSLDPEIPPHVTKTDAWKALTKSRKALKQYRRILGPNTSVDEALHSIAKLAAKKD